jgi:hypothetical protein
MSDEFRKVTVDGVTYLVMPDIPETDKSNPTYPGCTGCVAIHNKPLCDRLPKCHSPYQIYILPEKLEEYRVAYTIARLSQ